MRSARASLCSLALLTAASAAAYPQGITGAARDGCGSCHGSSVTDAVQVTLTGPASLDAGTRGDYVLTVRGGPARVAGFDVAVSRGGGVLEPGPDSQLAGDDATHLRPEPFDGGVARFHFTLRAPEQSRTVTLYGAGNSANGDGRSGGDAYNTTSLDVRVVGGLAPDAGGPADAGTQQLPDAGGPAPDALPAEAIGGCAQGGGAPLAPLGAAALLLRRRRRRRAPLR